MCGCDTSFGWWKYYLKGGAIFLGGGLLLLLGLLHLAGLQISDKTIYTMCFKTFIASSIADYLVLVIIPAIFKIDISWWQKPFSIIIGASAVVAVIWYSINIIVNLINLGLTVDLLVGLVGFVLILYGVIHWFILY